jgi:hypothetical protein
MAVGGFNLGVEGAQLLAMGGAVPLLAVSRFRMFHAVRVGTMVGATLLAGAWMVERGKALVVTEQTQTLSTPTAGKHPSVLLAL